MKQLVILSALVLTLSASVAAHHSAIQFDFTKSTPVTGVVKKFIAINPHMQLVLHVKDAKGERDIEFEGHSTNNMYRAGYRDNMIKVGDTITVYIAPLKDGSDGGYVTAALTASGTRFGARSRAEVEQERLKAEGAHDWPYQVTTISFLDAAQRLLSIGPPEGSPPPVKRGFLAYRDNCLPCHAVNGDGGTKSIDLVRPYSPVEYWKQSWLERWILNPAELRPGTTMPALAVGGEEGKRIASDIVAYLEAMARARRVKE